MFVGRQVLAGWALAMLVYWAEDLRKENENLRRTNLLLKSGWVRSVDQLEVVQKTRTDHSRRRRRFFEDIHWATRSWSCCLGRGECLERHYCSGRAVHRGHG